MIDKAAVHDMRNMLWAVAIVLIMFMVFSAVMRWTREAHRTRTGTVRAQEEMIPSACSMIAQEEKKIRAEISADEG